MVAVRLEQSYLAEAVSLPEHEVKTAHLTFNDERKMECI